MIIEKAPRLLFAGLSLLLSSSTWADFTATPEEARGMAKEAYLYGFPVDGLLKIVGATQTGITTEAFMDNTKTWLSQARHPKTGRPYTEMIYQPMLEMLDYLRSQDFKTYFVSSFVIQFQIKDGEPSILRTAKLAHTNDGPGKPQSIDAIIGRCPLQAFGDSDGDHA
ncbi:hypothetical protein PS691_01807 [Pseudomonas fluorescens]|uniref:Uncharacterized protein n=1 Tax=Pseudomonas fluorescens TaxID=294 RepID=A0A5E7BF45_PSEFL|nr:hypothetical protein PS691_01807 [Pseudomonas fluorescens]